MRFPRRRLRASVIRVIAAFAPLAGCSDALDVEDPGYNPPAPRCDGGVTHGCVPPLDGSDAGTQDASQIDDSGVVPDATTLQDATVSMDSAVVATACPAQLPGSGGACALKETQSCDYEPYCDTRPTRSARCISGRWQIGQSSCNPPPLQCPDAAPMEGAVCTLGWGGNQCNYGSCDGGAAETFQCSLASDGGTPATTSWHLVQRCGAPVCPSARPVHGTACSLPADASCGYDPCYNWGPATTAKCVGATWSVSSTSCNPPPPCPALAPAEDSICYQLTSQTCTFSLSAGGTVVGMCVGGRWKLGVADAGT